MGGSMELQEIIMQTIDSMSEALSAAGYYAEQCTSWYSAIYPIPKGA